MANGERAHVQVRLFGQVTVETDGSERFTPRGPTQRRLLAALALRRNETVSLPYLIEAIWPDGEEPDKAGHNIRTYVHRLRSSLGDDGDRVETQSGGYRLRLSAEELDLARFEGLAATAMRLAETGEAAEMFDAVRSAEELWIGPPLEEFADEAWALPVVVRTVDLAAEMRTAHARRLLVAGRPADATQVLERLTRSAPLREEPRALLMRSLYESGRHVDALRSFQAFRDQLIEDIGVEPSSELVELDRAISSGTLDRLAESPQTAGSYELHERIGEGAFAVVHRATQPSLNRQVAVKIIRAELANQPEFIRRFEAEAQMVAGIEHPNVVPLYDYWREPDRAFLVMRWMTGGSLEARLDDGPTTLIDAVAIINQIAGALDASHAAGVVHRDVKPANILFDAEQRAFLADFGIALAAEERSRPESALSEGSPVFAAPEQLRGQPVGLEADVHALGIVAFTLLTGRTPFADSADEATMLYRQLNEAIPSATAGVVGLPAAIDDVLAMATAKDPAGRYPSASGFARAFEAATLGEASGAQRPPVAGSGLNPYKGLRAFDETDASDFFGRERLTNELIEHLSVPDNRLLAVVGPSGSGKSSVVRAGLLPALRNGAVEGSSSWFTTTMIPGAHPFEALETALLRVAVNPPSALLEQLKDGDRGILRSIKRILPADDVSVTVVIDQFEELFTASTPDERDHFLRGVVVAATDPSAAVRFVITLRADFYDHPLRHPEFAPLLKQHTVVVTPLAPDEIRQAITMPALASGFEFEPGLVAEIVADVHDEPGALPLMQYALGRAFDAAKRDHASNMISAETYASIGGVTGAIGGRAEELFSELDDAGRQAAQRLFGRLVTLGEGTEDTRRRVLRAELEEGAATDVVIDRFAGARLLTFDRQAMTREPTIEVAHEALIREWPRLRGWLEDDRDDLRVHRHLTNTSAGWDQHDRDPAELYRGGRLEAAESLLEDGNVGLNPVETEFVVASAEARDLAREQEQRRVTRLKRLVAAVAVVAALAVGATVLAVVQAGRADDLAVEADVERMAAIARQSDPLDPTVAILLAVEAHRADPSDATLDAIHRAVTGRPSYLGQLASDDQVWDITALEDGVRVVVNTTASIDIWNVQTRTREASWPVDVGPGVGGSLAPIGTAGRLIYSSKTHFSSAAENGSVGAVLADQRLSVIDLATGATLGDLDLATTGTALAVSSTGSHLAVGSIDGRIELFEASDLSSPVWVAEREIHVADLAWAPDGTHFVSGHGNGELSMFSLDDPEPVWTFEGHDEWQSPGGDARGMLFSADGQRLLSVRQDQEFMRREAEGTNAESSLDISGIGQVIQEFEAGTGEAVGEAVPVFGDEISLGWADRSETAVVAAGIRSTLRVYDLTGAVGPRPVSGEGRGEGGAIAALLDLDTVVTANRTGMSLHSIRGSDAISTFIPLSARQLAGDPSAFRVFAWDDDSSDVVTGVFDFFSSIQQPERFDLSDPGGESTVMAEFAGLEYTNALIGFGPAVMAVSLNGTQARPGLDEEPAGFLRPIMGDGSGQAALSPNGEREIAWAGGFRGELLLNDTATGEVVADLTDLVGDDITWLHFSTDSARLDIYSSRRAYVFDAESGELIWVREESGALISGPGGEYYAVTDGQSTIQLLDQETREPVGAPYIGHAAEIFNLDFNVDATLISSRSSDGTIRVWGTESRRQLGREIIDRGNGAVKWSPDGTLMAYPEERGMRVWNYDTDSWIDIACEVAGRNLTEAEWEEFGPRTVDYRRTCERWSEAS